MNCSLLACTKARLWQQELKNTFQVRFEGPSCAREDLSHLTNHWRPSKLELRADIGEGG
jgi:hypothetical protein